MQDIRKIAKKEAKSVRRIKQYASLSTTFVLPFLIAILVGSKGDFNEDTKTLFWLLLIGLGIFQVLIGIAYGFNDENLAIEAYFLAEELEKQNNILNKNKQELEKDIRYLNILHNTIQAFRVLESDFVRNESNEEGLQDFIDITVSFIVDIREQIFDFNSEDLWSFSVYLYRQNDDLLESIWLKKHENHPSTGEPRKWKPGQGHIGRAFIDGVAKITGDATELAVANLMSPPPRLARDYDREAYKSFASIPISLNAEQEKPYGVLVVTSNKPNRFNKFNCLILNHVADTISNVIALRGILIDDI
ncbi:GAF domain-containing protein [Waterburya agarophytonicola K14]|uniref:GAF domain-containing protein n=1 Tax=Waterburya agarophytonicola KI4 TaxID=2874699 RepID=A0A964BW27_9CYAN|nr:GAF domain-containing protein [Waterburya agarophytonicola]MCC0179452.1 GAF domain-containing protein [Waterburya agarophytonicola KI4]